MLNFFLKNINQLERILEESYNFAKFFNEKIELRYSLWQNG